MPTALPAIETLIPHRGSMLLLERLLHSDADASRAECTPARDAWYADAEGCMPAWIGIELMAQTVAAHVGLRKLREGAAARPGVLLGTRRFSTCGVSAFDAGVPLQIGVRLAFQDPAGLAAYDCEIACAGAPLATAQLKVYEPADFQAFWEAAQA